MGVDKLDKSERWITYWLFWPVPVIICPILLVCVNIIEIHEKERYVVKNKYIKIKRRKWF